MFTCSDECFLIFTNKYDDDRLVATVPSVFLKRKRPLDVIIDSMMVDDTDSP